MLTECPSRSLVTSFAWPGLGYPLTMPDREPEDNRGLIDAERKEAEVEEEREEEAVHRTERRAEEYEAEKEAPD